MLELQRRFSKHMIEEHIEYEDEMERQEQNEMERQEQDGKMSTIIKSWTMPMKQLKMNEDVQDELSDASSYKSMEELDENFERVLKINEVW